MHRHSSSLLEDSSLLVEGSFSFQSAFIGMKFYQAFSEHIVLNRVNTVYLKTDPSEARRDDFTGICASWLSFSTDIPVIASFRKRGMGRIK